MAKMVKKDSVLKIFEGAYGYYLAYEGADGYHYQPADNGARLGFDYAAAERELAERVAEDDESWPEEED